MAGGGGASPIDGGEGAAVGVVARGTGGAAGAMGGAMGGAAGGAGAAGG